MRIGALLPNAVSPISMPQIRRGAMIRVAEAAAAAEAIAAVDEAEEAAAAVNEDRLGIIRMAPVRWVHRRPIIITVRRPITRTPDHPHEKRSLKCNAKRYLYLSQKVRDCAPPVNGFSLEIASHSITCAVECAC